MEMSIFGSEHAPYWLAGQIESGFVRRGFWNEHVPRLVFVSVEKVRFQGFRGCDHAIHGDA